MALVLSEEFDGLVASLEGANMVLRRLTKYQGPDLLTLDLILVNPTVEAAWRSRRRVPTLRGTLWVVDREALIEMKLRAGRPQDIFDVERLRDLDR